MFLLFTVSFQATELEKSLASLQARFSQSETEKNHLAQTVEKLTTRQAELQQELKSINLLPASPVAIDLGTPSRVGIYHKSVCAPLNAPLE